MPGAIIVGAGPGIGTAIARRLARERLPVGLIARSEATIDRFAVPQLLIYNAALIQSDKVGELTTRQHLDAWAVNVVGVITAAAHVAPRMAQTGAGTIVVTGGMPEPLPDMTSLSLGKAGGRALTALLATLYEPAGIHVATVTVTGCVAPGTAFDPDDIAEHYWRLHSQPTGAWEREIVHTG